MKAEEPVYLLIKCVLILNNFEFLFHRITLDRFICKNVKFKHFLREFSIKLYLPISYTFRNIKRHSNWNLLFLKDHNTETTHWHHPKYEIESDGTTTSVKYADFLNANQASQKVFEESNSVSAIPEWLHVYVKSPVAETTTIPVSFN